MSPEPGAPSLTRPSGASAELPSEQQAVTSEILRVISTSPHDVWSVFETIVAERGAALRRAQFFSAVTRSTADSSPRGY